MQNPVEANIPVLTEVIELLPTEPVSADASLSYHHDAETTTFTEQARESRTISEEDWLALEQQIKDNVLKQVLARIDFVLEHRVRDTLADVLQTAVDSLAENIRAGLKNSLDDVITRALTQEIAKNKAPK